MPELVVIVALASVCEVVIRFVSLPRLARLFRVSLSGGADAATAEASAAPVRLPHWAARRATLVKRVMRHWPVDGACLRQSLVLGHRLRRLEPVLHVGVRKSGTAVAAHAWIEVAGRSLDRQSVEYHPFGELAER